MLTVWQAANRILDTAVKRGSKHSAETRRKMSEARAGKPKSAEHRAAIGAANAGRVVTDETRSKIRETLRGRSLAPEHRAAISRGLRGNAFHRKHGMTGTPTWRSYRSMRDRCERPATNGYKRYGGRGIKVCDRWKGREGFTNFLADLGERPEGTTLDRVALRGSRRVTTLAS